MCVKPAKFMLFCLFMLGVLSLTAVFMPRAFCFFSDNSLDNLQVASGNLSVALNGLDTQPTQIRANGRYLLDFSVDNVGTSPADCTVTLKMQAESPQLLQTLYLYPSHLTENEIFLDIYFESAALALTPSIVQSDQLVFNLDTFTLPQQTSKNLLFNGFYYSFDQAFSSQTISYTIECNSVLHLSPAPDNIGWNSIATKTISLVTPQDTVSPVLSETVLPKTYFVTQTDQLGLSQRATATDDVDGDVTGSIFFISRPLFTPSTAGEYDFYYFARDAAGNHALPLVIHITVWNFVKIESGNYHTLALTSHGQVYSWGYNANGQLGVSGESQTAPKKIPTLSGIVDIAAGNGFSLALDGEGRAFAWGNGANGRLGTGSTASTSTPTAVNQGEVRFSSVAAGFLNGGAVSRDGDVYTWGYGGYGGLGTGTAADRLSPTRIALSGVKKLAMGYYNGAALTESGELYTWGDNLHGQLGGGQPMAVAIHSPQKVDFAREVTDFSVGWYHMLAVCDGDLYSWGYGAEGRLGTGSAADTNKPVLVKITGGEIVDDFEPALRGGLFATPTSTRVVGAVASYYHSAVLLDSGAVMFFGQNVFGKHGTGNEQVHPLPTLLPLGAVTQVISLALDSSFVLVDGREVYGMGYGGTGVLGTGNNSNSTSPKLWAFTPPPPV